MTETQNILEALERLERRIQKMERHQEVLAETVSLFVRAWLTNTAEVPEDQRDAAVVSGGRRYRKFLEGLAMRLKNGKSLFADLPEEIFEIPEAAASPDAAERP